MLPTPGGEESPKLAEATDLKRTRSVVGYLILSSLTAVMLLIGSWIGPWTGTMAFEDRLIVGLVFVGSCAMGILLSLGSHKLHSMRKSARRSDSRESADRAWVGHHPDCGRFGEHVIAINRHRYCAGCLGLALGSFVSLAIMAFYLLVPPVDVFLGRWLVVLGMCVVSICMAEVTWHPAAPRLHVLSNLFLMIGFLVVIIGVTSSNTDVMLSLLAILICFLWLDTRIQISDWKHAKACGTCDRSCRAY
jgi:magnesium-transporting ATPase (P-type)